MKASTEAVELNVSDLALRFGRRWALARISFHLPAGERMMITGANGSGKTTLLRCLATALRAQRGTISINGQDLWENRASLRQKIAYFSHASRLYDDLSARDNLGVWARLGGFTVDSRSLLEQVGLPTDRADPVRTFSAGMRRRLSFARILMKKPNLLLLDEPFSALDPKGRGHIASLIDDLARRGATLLIATHLPGEAAHLCTQELHLEAGQIIRQTPSADAGGDE